MFDFWEAEDISTTGIESIAVVVVVEIIDGIRLRRTGEIYIVDPR